MAATLLEDLGYDRAEILHRLRFIRPDSSFRSRYAYTNFGLTAAAVAAARPAANPGRTFRPSGCTGRWA